MKPFQMRRVSYGNSTHLNISVEVEPDNKAVIRVALDRRDKVIIIAQVYIVKPSCHIPFTHAVSASRCVFQILKLLEPANVSTRKTQRTEENACMNGMCKRAFKNVNVCSL